MNQTYEKLLQLPLFFGMSRNEMTELVGYTKLGFHKREAGRPIVSEHDACKEMIFLIGGEMVAKKSSDSHDYTICERIAAPMMIEPERLFGLYQHYTRSYTAFSECQLLTIQKPDVLAICQSHNICFLNLLGIISTSAQKCENKPWHEEQTSIERRILHFLSQRMLTQTGKKVAKIKMQTLASNIHESRLNVSRVLNRWCQEGLIENSRGVILIPEYSRLTANVKH